MSSQSSSKDCSAVFFVEELGGICVLQAGSHNNERSPKHVPTQVWLSSTLHAVGKKLEKWVVSARLSCAYERAWLFVEVETVDPNPASRDGSIDGRALLVFLK